MGKILTEARAIANAVKNWLEVYLPAIHSKSPHTRKSYREALSEYFVFLESIKDIAYNKLDSTCFDAPTIESWIRWIKETRRCGPSTCNHRLAVLRSFLEYLAHQDIRFIEAQMNASEVKYLKVPKKGIMEVSKKAMNTFFTVFDCSTKTGFRDMALFYFMYHTATRIGEVLSMRIENLHLNEENQKNYAAITGKGAKRRTIYLRPEVVKILKKYILEFHGDKPEADALVFYSSYGGQIHALTENAVIKRLKMYTIKAHKKCAEVPLDLHCHSLRSARATHWLENGLHIVMIQKLLGHEDISTTTKNYVGVSAAQKAKALEAMEDDVAKNASKKWKGVRKNSSLAEILGLK